MVNTFFGFCVKLYQAVFPFIMRTVMLHTIGIGYLGLNGLFSSVLQILSISELGISGAIVYSMYEPAAKHDSSVHSCVFTGCSMGSSVRLCFCWVRPCSPFCRS